MSKIILLTCRCRGTNYLYDKNVTHSADEDACIEPVLLESELLSTDALKLRPSNTSYSNFDQAQSTAKTWPSKASPNESTAFISSNHQDVDANSETSKLFLWPSSDPFTSYDIVSNYAFYKDYVWFAGEEKFFHVFVGDKIRNSSPKRKSYYSNMESCTQVTYDQTIFDETLVTQVRSNHLSYPILA